MQKIQNKNAQAYVTEEFLATVSKEVTIFVILISVTF